MTEKINFKGVIVLCIIIVLSGFFLTIYSLGSTINSQEMWRLEFCLESRCVLNFIDMTKGSYTFVYWCGVTSSGTFALVSAVLLIKNYIFNVKTQNISNNISQYKHFSEYVESLVCRYDQISPKSISTLDWYHALYESPADGSFSISKDYIEKISALDLLIDSSNNDFVSGGEYKFREHQNQLVQLVSEFGIEVHTGPRTAFFEAERQLISLINDVHSMFVPRKRGVCQIRDAKFM